MKEFFDSKNEALFYFIPYRYIVIEVLGATKDPNEAITGLSIYEALRNVYHDLYGDFGLAALGTFGGESHTAFVRPYMLYLAHFSPFQLTSPSE